MTPHPPVSVLPAGRTQLGAKELGNARAQYVEQFGSPLVTNSYLRIALVLMALVAAGAMLFSWQTFARYSRIEPIVIRINEVGRADAVRYRDTQWSPQEPELKYFLTQFVQDFYGRRRATVKDDVSRSLYFLDRQLGESILADLSKSKAIENVLIGGAAEVSVVVNNVVLTNTKTSPFSAQVDYQKLYKDPGQQRPSKVESFVGTITYERRREITSNMIPVNPLGLTITYFREDQVFSEQKK